ncbi:MAG: outer membrane beta-barrel protein [Bryobacterales bacterium]|nr:outer membrane beta-barrel protein [Bryobacterales bacterium]
MFRVRNFVAPLLLLGAALPVAAQDFHRATFHLGGGFTQPVQETEDRVKRGFNLLAGGGINVTRNFSLVGEFGYNQLRLSDRTLSQFNVPGGEGRMLSVTIQPTVRFRPESRFDVYLTAGGGWYRRTIEFTEPTTAVVNIFDPWYGVFYPVEVPANTVLGRYTQNKGGINAGGGIEIRISDSDTARIFAEARYHHVYTRPLATNIIPVTFGFRW